MCVCSVYCTQSSNWVDASNNFMHIRQIWYSIFMYRISVTICRLEWLFEKLYFIFVNCHPFDTQQQYCTEPFGIQLNSKSILIPKMVICNFNFSNCTKQNVLWILKFNWRDKSSKKNKLWRKLWAIWNSTIVVAAAADVDRKKCLQCDQHTHTHVTIQRIESQTRSREHPNTK